MTEIINVHSAEVVMNADSFQPKVKITASFPLVKLGTTIPELNGLTEQQVLEKLAKTMLEQSFALIEKGKQ